MTRSTHTAYRRKDAEGNLWVVVLMPKGDAEAIDDWGVPAGHPSRTSAVRYLLRKGLEAVKASGNSQNAG